MKLVPEPYLLSVCVPITRDAEGCHHTDQLWFKDLALHLEYIEDLALVCPVVHGTPSPGHLPLTGPPFDRVKIVAMPAFHSRLVALFALPRMVSTLWRAVGKAQVVHTGFGGWPLNDSWLICPMAKLRGKLLLTNVESSFWRAGPAARWHRRLRGFIEESLNRWWVRAADLRFFTTTAYLRDFLPSGAPRAYVTPATWIDDEWVLGEADAAATWDEKSGPVRLLFAGRMIQPKGVLELLEAARSAGRMDTPLEITVIGEGPLQGDCLQASRELTGSVRLCVLEPVPFGPPFFSMVRRHDAVLIPSLSDEQPRLLFDALSQAVPVIGSDTGGIREVIAPDETGRLVPPGDVKSLAEAMIWASRNRPTLRAMGMRGLEAVRSRTHRAMHQNRGAIIRQALDMRK